HTSRPHPPPPADRPVRPPRTRPCPGGRAAAPPSAHAPVREDLKRGRAMEVTGSAGRPVREAPPLPAAVSALSQAERSHQAGVGRPDLGSPQRLREAFILKEILDAPVARRPRR